MTCMSGCDPKDCCSNGSPGATKPDSAGPTSSEHPARVASCRNCGNDPEAVVRAFKAGMQAAAWDTYAGNLRATELRAELEAQWHGHVKRYGE